MNFNIEEAKQLFIREELDIHGDDLLFELSEQIQEKELIHSEVLISSLSYQVKKINNDWILSVSFPGYGRAIEIRYHKKQNYNEETNDVIKKLFKIESADDVLRKKTAKKKKNTLWYSKTVYGSLNSLYSTLSYGFTDDEIERLKKIISKESYNKIGDSFIGKTYSAI